MAVHTRACGAADIFPNVKQKGYVQKTTGLLDHKKMSAKTEKTMPGMGVQGGKTLLVYQWNHMQWHRS